MTNEWEPRPTSKVWEGEMHLYYSESPETSVFAITGSRIKPSLLTFAAIILALIAAASMAVWYMRRR